MGESLPKAVKVWMAANILAIEFDNGQTDTCDHIILRIIFRLGHLKKVKANGLT